MIANLRRQLDANAQATKLVTPVPPPLNVMVIDTDPTRAWLAVFGLLALSAMVLACSAYSARHTEISYGE